MWLWVNFSYSDKTFAKKPKSHHLQRIWKYSQNLWNAIRGLEEGTRRGRRRGERKGKGIGKQMICRNSSCIPCILIQSVPRQMLNDPWLAVLVPTAVMEIFHTISPRRAQGLSRACTTPALSEVQLLTVSWEEMELGGKKVSILQIYKNVCKVQVKDVLHPMPFCTAPLQGYKAHLAPRKPLPFALLSLWLDYCFDSNIFWFLRQSISLLFCFDVTFIMSFITSTLGFWKPHHCSWRGTV